MKLIKGGDSDIVNLDRGINSHKDSKSSSYKSQLAISGKNHAYRAQSNHVAKNLSNKQMIDNTVTEIAEVENKNNNKVEMTEMSSPLLDAMSSD